MKNGMGDSGEVSLAQILKARGLFLGDGCFPFPGAVKTIYLLFFDIGYAGRIW